MPIRTHSDAHQISFSCPSPRTLHFTSPSCAIIHPSSPSKAPSNATLYRPSNIVGYLTSTIDTMGQQKMVGGAFVSVGGEALDIQSIGVTGEPDDEGAWIKWWDPVKKTYDVKAVYVSELYREDEPIVPKTAGWGDGDWNIIEKTFNPGEGFFWGVNKDGCGLTISGEVYIPSTKTIGSKIETMGQQKMVINPFPMDLDIQSLTVDGNPADEGAWIKWWDPVKKTYDIKAVYVSELYKNDQPIVPKTAGWGDGDWNIIEKTFVPGEGFWWGVNKDNCTLVFRNPFYVEEK